MCSVDLEAIAFAAHDGPTVQPVDFCKAMRTHREPHGRIRIAAGCHAVDQRFDGFVDCNTLREKDAVDKGAPLALHRNERCGQQRNEADLDRITIQTERRSTEGDKGFYECFCEYGYQHHQQRIGQCAANDTINVEQVVARDCDEEGKGDQRHADGGQGV